MSAPPSIAANLSPTHEGLEERFRRVLEAMPNAIVMINSDGIISLVNAQTERLFGYTRDALLGQAIEILVPERVRARHPNLRNQFFLNPVARSMGTGRELHGVTQDGKEVPIEIGLNPIQTEDGVFVLASIIDITERKKLTELAERAEKRFRQTIEIVKDHAIYMIDPSGCMLSWNRGAERLKGYTEAEVLGRHMSMFYPQAAIDDKVPEKELSTALAHGQYENEGWRYKKDGSPFFASVLVTAMYDEAGGLLGFSKVVRDITERMRERERLRDAQNQLLQAEKMASLGGLVAGIAHEINTPVGITVTAASHLQEQVQSLGAKFESGTMKKSDLTGFIEDGQEAARIILANASRAADLIHSFKMIAVDQSSNDARKLELRGYLNDVLLSLRPQLRRAPVELTLDCPEGILITTTPGGLSQIIANLVTNAMMHAYDPGQTGLLTLCVRILQEHTVELKFTDDGKGMTPDIVGKIFDPFFTTRRGSGGSGLGLHIVFNLVEKTLGGTIAVDSTPGAGTRFTIRFPKEARKNSEAHS